MRIEVRRYIDRIRRNDETLMSIELENKGLSDDDVAPLMQALAENPEAAQRITELDLTNNQIMEINIPEELVGIEYLDLSCNKLLAFNISAKLVNLIVLGLISNMITTIKIPAELVSLEYLDIRSNSLTIATEVVFGAERLKRGNNIKILSDNQMPANTALTHEILNEHLSAVVYNVVVSNLLYPLCRMDHSIIVSRESLFAQIEFLKAALPDSMARMALNSFLTAQRKFIGSYIAWLKASLPVQANIINDSLKNDEFMDAMNAFYCVAIVNFAINMTYYKSRYEATLPKNLMRAYKICEGRKTGFTTQSDIKFTQKGFFMQYKYHNPSTPRNTKLADETRIAPKDNPYQVAIRA